MISPNLTYQCCFLFFFISLFAFSVCCFYCIITTFLCLKYYFLVVLIVASGCNCFFFKVLHRFSITCLVFYSYLKKKKLKILARLSKCCLLCWLLYYFCFLIKKFHFMVVFFSCLKFVFHYSFCSSFFFVYLAFFFIFFYCIYSSSQFFMNYQSYPFSFMLYLSWNLIICLIVFVPVNGGPTCTFALLLLSILIQSILFFIRKNKRCTSLVISQRSFSLSNAMTTLISRI